MSVKWEQWSEKERREWQSRQDALAAKLSHKRRDEYTNNCLDCGALWEQQRDGYACTPADAGSKAAGYKTGKHR